MHSANSDTAVLGGALPPAAEQALRDASAARGGAAREGAALMRAQTLAPEHPAVLIAPDRDHFYAQRLQPARAAAGADADTDIDSDDPDALHTGALAWSHLAGAATPANAADAP